MKTISMPIEPILYRRAPKYQEDILQALLSQLKNSEDYDCKLIANDAQNEVELIYKKKKNKGLYHNDGE